MKRSVISAGLAAVMTMTKIEKKLTKLRFSLLSAAVITVMVAAISGVYAETQYAPGKYEIDPQHSRLSFVIPHFVISVVEGRFNDVKGDFTLGEPFSASKANVTVPIESVDTGVKLRDDDLRSKHYFEVSKYPTMTFVAKSFNGTPESCKVTGNLTIKGVTKEVIFDGKYTGYVNDPWGNQRAAIQLTGVIDRRDFNISFDEPIYLGPGVGYEVKIRIVADGTMKIKGK